MTVGSAASIALSVIGVVPLSDTNITLNGSTKRKVCRVVSFVVSLRFIVFAIQLSLNVVRTLDQFGVLCARVVAP